MNQEQRKQIALSCPDSFRVHRNRRLDWADDIYFLSNGVFILWTDDNGLNAMHEAEKTLTWAQRLTYEMRIGELVGRTVFDLLHVTADKKAEAFLLVI